MSLVKSRDVRIVVALAAVLGALEYLDYDEECVARPLNTGFLTGQRWLDELIGSHPERFRRQMGLSQYGFVRLRHEFQVLGLSDSKYVSATEQLGIFMHYLRTGSSNRMLQERFQRSGETIHKFEIISSL